MKKHPLVIIPVLVMALGSGAGGQRPATVTLLDGETLRGSLSGVAQDGALQLEVAGQPRQVATGQLLSVTFGRGRFVRSDAPVRLELGAGDVLLGAIDDGRLDEIAISCPSVGALKLQLDDVRRLILRRNLPKGMVVPTSKGEDDEIFLLRGRRLDRIRCEVVRLTRAAVVVDTPEQEGRRLLFDKQGVVAVRLAPLEPVREPKGLLAVARFNDGSVVTGSLLPGNDLRLRLLVGPTVGLEPRMLDRLDFRSPRFEYLSDRKPAAIEEQPLLQGGTPRGILLDRGFQGEPRLQIGERQFLRGIGLHARTQVTWNLDGGFKRFRAWVGTDPTTRDRSLPGSVRVQVLVDGKQRFRSRILTAGQAPVAVKLDGLEGCRKLSILVDFGESFSIGARGVIGDPVVLK